MIIDIRARLTPISHGPNETSSLGARSFTRKHFQLLNSPDHCAWRFAGAGIPAMPVSVTLAPAPPLKVIVWEVAPAVVGV